MWALYLGGLDVVVEVITEGLDVRDVLITTLRGQMAREQDYMLC
jgi:hypothetical protein